MDHSMWAPQIQAFEDEFRLIAPEMPGFGSSPEAPDGWQLPDAARSVLELADSLDLATFSLAGLSMGGYLSFEIYRQAPERVDALLLADTRARADTPEERQARTELAQEVKRDGIALLSDRIMPRLVGKDPGTKIIGKVWSIIEHATPGAVANALEAIGGRLDSTRLLGEIHCPTLVVAGREDAITSTADCRQMAGQASDLSPAWTMTTSGRMSITLALRIVPGCILLDAILCSSNSAKLSVI